jgi:UDP-N-acetylglucosamine pyrophosphorylase
MSSFTPFAEKMQQAGLSAGAVRAFQNAYESLVQGSTGLISEADIQPAQHLPKAAALPLCESSTLLDKTVVIKLNGGLGTSMGLEKAKSLLPVRAEDTFLDLIAQQHQYMKQQTQGAAPRFLLMNSFSTSADTQAHLRKRWAELGNPTDMELLQNRVPKILVESLEPLHWAADPDLEWCPPGHGDIYACLLDSGWLDRLLEQGVIYAFVSNSDNLGATLQPSLLEWFAQSQLAFAMEVTRRTAADRKGGHLALRKADQRLLLRESAQCPKEETNQFQDIERHQFFNTNNIWIRLDRLKEELTKHGGLIPLPIIVNRKTANPRDPKSPAVIQLESAMGAAIEAFADAGAIEVPRSRFAPVKTTADLLAVRSDAYYVTPKYTLELIPERAGQPPQIELQGYTLVEQLDTAFPVVPSLRDCKKLSVRGPVQCSASVIFQGEVTVHNSSEQVHVIQPGVYADEDLLGKSPN